MANYHEFSIESAIMPTTTRRSIKIEGVNNVKKIFADPSKSTEAFITGAIADTGAADRNIMYVNKTLGALSDRLQTAAKIAKSVNTAKDRGVEGFQSVEYLNPWEYAIEGKTSAYFKKIWDSIQTICRKIISAIANAIKWLSNQIQSAFTKAQVKDYNYYKANKATLGSVAKKSKSTVKSIEWVPASEFSKVLVKFNGEYMKAVRSKSADMVTIEKIGNMDASLLTDPTKFGKIFSEANAGFHWGSSAESNFKGFRSVFQKMIDSINKELEDVTTSAFGRAQEGKQNAHSVVYGRLAKSDTVKEMEVSRLCEISGDFSILSDSWMADNVKSYVTLCNESMKSFTQYTKAIDKVAKKFDDAVGKTDKDNAKISSLSQLTSQLCNARCRYNSYMTSILLEVESAALRYRRSAHNALKAVIAEVKGGPAKAAKAKATESYQSVESLFDFN